MYVEDEKREKYYGKRIKNAKLIEREGGGEDSLQLEFEDGTGIDVWDNGQSCCESRYITCDDIPEDLIGGRLVKIEARDGGSEENEYGEHETMFVEVATDRAFITLTTHNEHNGYYGGFMLEITERVGRPEEGE